MSIIQASDFSLSISFHLPSPVSKFSLESMVHNFSPSLKAVLDSYSSGLLYFFFFYNSSDKTPAPGKTNTQVSPWPYPEMIPTREEKHKAEQITVAEIPNSVL